MNTIRLKKLYLCLLVAAVLAGNAQAWAEGTSSDISKELIIREQKNLTANIMEYRALIREYNLDSVDLKGEREWIVLKMKRIEDQGRETPSILKQTVARIDGKLSFYDHEIKRLNDLVEQHVKDIKNLDRKVRRTYGNPAPSWWVIGEGVLPLAPYKPKLIRKKIKRDEPHDVAHEENVKESSSHVSEQSPPIVEDLAAKIKAADMESWIALDSVDQGVKLDVRLPILFGKGKTDVAEGYKHFFQTFSTLIKPYHVVIEVAGFPDNQITDKKDFVSSMAMGTRRAANVVKELMKNGLPASAFKIISENGGDDEGHKDGQAATVMKRRVELNVFISDSEA